MKSLEELKKIRDIESKKLVMRDVKTGPRVIVGMGTVGIEAGARDVLLALVSEVENQNAYDITVLQNGYIEKTGNEPVVKVLDKEGKEVASYEKVTVADCKKIIESIKR